MSVNIFDAGYYASVNPDLAQNGVTTFEQLSTHLLNSGLNEGRAFSPFVDLNFYRSSYPDLAQNGVNTNRAAFDHLQNSGVAEGRRFSPFVDVNHYLNAHSDLRQAFGSNREAAFQHLVTNGVVEPRQFSSSFDPSYYRSPSIHPDLAGQPNWNNVSSLEHFKNSGLNEGRASSSSFAINTYKSENPDARNLNNLQAYLNYVIQEIQSGSSRVRPRVEPESPNSPGPGSPVNLVAPAGWNVTYDESDIWVAATRDFYGGAFTVNFQDDPLFEGGGVDETLLLSIDSTLSGGWGFIQDSYTANEGDQVATIRLSPTSNIKNATLDIIDDDWNNDFGNSISINEIIRSDTGSSNPEDYLFYSDFFASTNVGATKELNEPNHANNTGGSSVWWSWTAPISRIVEIDTSGSSLDTVLGVYTGSSVSQLTPIVSNDDDPDRSDFSDRYSRVLLNAVAGTTYQIAVDGFSGATGGISLNLQPLESTFSQENDLNIIDKATVTSPLEVSSLPGTIADVNVELNFSHPFQPDLAVFLVSPDATRVKLLSNAGTRVPEIRFTTVQLDDEGFTPIALEGGEISGSYQPESFLSIFDGINPNGIWSLEIRDDAALDTGTLFSWRLTFNLQ